MTPLWHKATLPLCHVGQTGQFNPGKTPKNHLYRKNPPVLPIWVDRRENTSIKYKALAVFPGLRSGKTLTLIFNYFGGLSGKADIAGTRVYSGGGATLPEIGRAKRNQKRNAPP
jgi:hypothetical protein